MNDPNDLPVWVGFLIIYAMVSILTVAAGTAIAFGDHEDDEKRILAAKATLLFPLWPFFALVVAFVYVRNGVRRLVHIAKGDLDA